MRFEQPRIFQWGAESRKAVLSTVFGFLCVSSWRTGSDSAGRCRMVCCAILNVLLSSGKTFRRSSSRGLLFDVFLDCLLCVLSRILLFGTAFRCLLSRLSLFTAFCAEGLRGLRRVHPNCGTPRRAAARQSESRRAAPGLGAWVRQRRVNPGCGAFVRAAANRAGPGRANPR